MSETYVCPLEAEPGEPVCDRDADCHRDFGHDGWCHRRAAVGPCFTYRRSYEPPEPPEPGAPSPEEDDDRRWFVAQ